jgi:hypothetical protein
MTMTGPADPAAYPRKEVGIVVSRPSAGKEKPMTAKATPESVIRAMDAHTAGGRIRGWRHRANAPWKRGGTERPFYLDVDLVGGDSIELRTLREATVFVAALASAHHAQLAAESPVSEALAAVDKAMADGFAKDGTTKRHQVVALHALACAVRAAAR